MTRSRARRSKLLARLVTIALSGVILLQAVWLGRGLLEGWICRKIESALFDATGSQAEVHGLAGNWLNYFVIEDLSLTGTGEALLQDVDRLRVEVWVSPIALLGGDLGGLRSCRITAARADIRTDGVLPDREAGAGGESASLVGLTDLFPAGAHVEIRDFAYGNEDARRVDELQLDLKPGAGRRIVSLVHGGFRAQLSVHADDSEGLGLGIGLLTEEPGDVLRAFGLDNDSRGGELRLSGHCLVEPLAVAGTLQLSELRYGERAIDASRLSWYLDSGSLLVHEGGLRLAGVSLRTDGLMAPSPIASTGMPLETWRGNLDAEITDLGPYVELLPQLRDWLPMQGRIGAFVDRGRLHIVEAWLSTEDARLRLGPGNIELSSRGSGQLEFVLEASSPRRIEVPGIGELETTGSVRGRLAGNLSDPSLEGRVDLGPTSLGGFRAGRLSAGVAYSDHRLRFSDLEAFEVGTAPTEALSHIAGEATVDLRDTSLELSVEGQASEAWLEAFGVREPPAVAAPSFRVNGQASFGSELPSGSAELLLSGLALQPHPPSDVSASLTMSDDGVLDVALGTVQGPVDLSLTGNVTLPGGPMRWVVTAPEQDLTLPTALLPGGPLQGTFNLDLEAEGQADELVFALALRADVHDAGDRLARFWPRESLGPAPEGSGRLDLRLSQNTTAIEVEALSVECASTRVTGAGAIPLYLQPDRGLILRESDRSLDLAVSLQTPGPESMDLPLRLISRVRVGANELRIEELGLDAGPGRVSGTVSVATGWADWLGSPPASPALAGDLELEEFSLRVLPAEALGLSVLQGTLTGHAVLAGTVDRPEPHVELSLADASIKVGTLPRLERLGVDIEIQPDRIALSSLTGTMGGGVLSGELTALSENGHLWETPADTAISGRLTGRDVLLADEQNLRVRGHMDVELAGTANDLLVGGSVRITNGRYARRLNLLPDLSVRGGATGAVSGAVSLVPIDSVLGQRVRIDLTIATLRDFQIRTHVLDTDLICDLRLSGQASLAYLQGTVSSSAGLLRMPGAALRIDSILVSIPPENPLQPEVVAQATGRRHGVRIQLQVHGPLANPEVQISSIPAFSPQELWTLVTAGALPETLRNKGLEGQAALVGSYLAEELAAWYTGGESMEDTTSFLDRFTFVSGSDISDTGQENLIAEFALTDNLFLQGELDVYEDYNGGIVLRFRF